MKPTIYHFTNIAPLYRTRLWQVLLGSKLFDFYQFFGTNEGMGIKSINFEQEIFVQNASKLIPIKNRWVKQKYLIWQSGVLRRVLFDKMDMVILLGEFAIISNWLAAIICRSRGIKVVFRGHGIYGNEGRFKRLLRISFYRLANSHLLYERRSKKIMVSRGFDPNTLHVFFNSLDYDTHKVMRENYKNTRREEVFHFFKRPERPTLIFVGRLTKIKKIDLLVQATAQLNELGLQTNLLLIGDGKERNALEQMASELLPDGSYHFYGACYNETELGKYLSASDICVSPGNVGLTAIHSLSCGTPVCTHDSFENQMPEVEALEIRKTGIFFKQDDLDDLVCRLKEWMTDDTMNKEEIREACFQIIDEYYNPYYQEKVIENLVNGGSAML